MRQIRVIWLIRPVEDRPDIPLENRALCRIGDFVPA
jgi:hypothetical protein